jgi:hypothetical protein
MEEILDSIQSKKTLKDMPSRGLTELFHFKNIIPVQVSLVWAFVNLESFDPDSVAQALLSAMISKTDDSLSSKDSSSEDSSSKSSSSDSISLEQEKNQASNATPKSTSSHKSPSDAKTPKTRSGRQPRNESPKDSEDHQISNPIDKSWVSEFGRILQFCYLCSKERVKNIVCSISSAPDILSWQSSIAHQFLCPNPVPTELQKNLYHTSARIASMMKTSPLTALSP